LTMISSRLSFIFRLNRKQSIPWHAWDGSSCRRIRQLFRGPSAACISR
jgi:hypothetical protein